MRAAILRGPGDLRIDAVPEPVPGPGEVVLNIGAALSCGTDVKSVRRGHPSIAGYPSRLGHEFAGVVHAVGPGVTTVGPGDRVFCGNSAPCGVCRPCRRGRESLCEDLEYLLGEATQQVEQVLAQALVPAGAGAADPARCRVAAEHAVAGADGGDTGADRVDNARELVPEA